MKYSLNQISVEYGEKIMIAYESYLDAILSNVDCTKLEFDTLASAVDDMVLMSKITAYAHQHASQILKENREYDLNQLAIKQAVGRVEPVGIYTSRLMDAAAQSIDLVYEDYDRETGRKRIGSHTARTNKELYIMIASEVQKVGDRDILANAKYSNTFNCFRIIK